MKITQNEFEAVLKLPGEKRYQYFVKRVADASKLWGLWDNGWAMGVTNEGQSTIPLWPAAEYAEPCRQGDWGAYLPKSIELHDFMDNFLPRLIRDGVRVSIFDTPSGDGILVNDDDLVADLRHELSKIE